ncbi:MAG TPA: DUF305 domain-containing protein [Pseudonocardiaceae bacterium]
MSDPAAADTREPDDEFEDPRTEHVPAAGWVRVLVVAAGVVALLLMGAAAGLLLAQSGDPANDTAPPAPDSVAVGFSQDMTVHHRQAIQMAGLARDRSTDPAVRNLAFDIETNQLDQVGRMQGWLNLWGRDPIPFGGHMAWMSGAGHGHGGATTGAGGAVRLMPGMATGDELAELRRLEGTAFDVRFLQLMLRHHQGGAEMAGYAAEHAEVGVVRNLAGQMRTAQASESDLLASMIRQRGGEPLPAPN